MQCLDTQQQGGQLLRLAGRTTDESDNKRSSIYLQQRDRLSIYLQKRDRTGNKVDHLSERLLQEAGQDVWALIKAAATSYIDARGHRHAATDPQGRWGLGGGGLQDRGEERLLQHAGQDACGLVKADGTSTYIKMHGHSWTQARLGVGVA